MYITETWLLLKILLQDEIFNYFWDYFFWFAGLLHRILWALIINTVYFKNKSSSYTAATCVYMLCEACILTTCTTCLHRFGDTFLHFTSNWVVYHPPILPKSNVHADIQWNEIDFYYVVMCFIYSDSFEVASYNYYFLKFFLALAPFLEETSVFMFVLKND